MKIEKRFLAKLDRCYATSSMVIDNELKLLFATEGQGACYMYSYPGYNQSTVWDGPGGTMSIVPIPGKNGEFLAVQNFFPTFQSEKATIVWGKIDNNGEWRIKNVLDLPFVHRFDILQSGGVNYFLAATLCTSKKDKDDWSDPGKIWVGILPDNPETDFYIHPIKEGLVRNHGYCHVNWKGTESGIVTCDQGAFVVTPPEAENGLWSIKQILDRPISDIAICDIDNDGEEEIITIEPFHGRKIAISKLIDGKYNIVWEYDKPVDFGHVVWGGKLCGVNTFICGYRKEEAELLLIQYDPDNNTSLFKTTVIESGIGPSNISVVNCKDEDIIMSANRMAGEAVVYIVTK